MPLRCGLEVVEREITGETAVDGARVNLTEYGCAKALIGGEWQATQMQPCSLGVSGSAAS